MAAAQSRGVPVVHPGEAAACSAPSPGVPMVHPGEAAACAAASPPVVYPGEAAACAAASPPVVDPGEAAACAAASPPVVDPGEAEACAPANPPEVDPGDAAACAPASPPAVDPGEPAACAPTSPGVPVVHPGEAAAYVAPEAGASSSEGVQMVHLGEGVEVTALTGGSAALVALGCNLTAQNCEESADKHHTKKALIGSSGKIQQEHHTEDNADMGLSGGVLQKQTSKVEADTRFSGEMLHEHPAKEADASLSGEMLDQHQHPTEEADTAKDMKESDPNEAVHVKEVELHTQGRHEVELLIKELNQLGVGEDISDEEFLAYFDQLACGPPFIDRKAELTEEELVQQYVRHALCRFRYLKYKFSQQVSKEGELHGDDLLKEVEEDEDEGEHDTTLKENHPLYLDEDDTTSEEDDNLMDKTEADLNLEFLEEKLYFISFEKDGTLDWFFHPDYSDVASLCDYQRLVLRNYGGTEYSMWRDYHSYLHSYDIEQEYVKYCEELSKRLKWMECYVDICRKSIKWDCISCRGAYQAIKIAATFFTKITPTLAYLGYDEYKQNIGYAYTFFKEYDGLFFEIWLRVRKGKSFREALEGVCDLNKFPARQVLMQTALGHEFTMMLLEKDFHTCAGAIHPEVNERIAKELIADAVKKRVVKPKTYDEYIRRKIEIANIIGILPSNNASSER